MGTEIVRGLLGESSAERSPCDSPSGLSRVGAGKRGALRCGGSSMGGERETDATFLGEEESRWRRRLTLSRVTERRIPYCCSSGVRGSCPCDGGGRGGLCFPDPIPDRNGLCGFSLCRALIRLCAVVPGCAGLGVGGVREPFFVLGALRNRAPRAVQAAIPRLGKAETSVHVPG